MKHRLLLVCLAVTLALAAIPTVFGADEPAAETKDPIDKQVERMMEKDPSTAGTVAALEEGCKLWDREMNRAYAKLMGVLPAEAREALKQAQRTWITYRDSEKILSGKIYERAQGTMYVPVPVSDRLELVKARTKQLRVYLEAAESAEGK